MIMIASLDLISSTAPILSPFLTSRIAGCTIIHPDDAQDVRLSPTDLPLLSYIRATRRFSINTHQIVP